MIRSHYTAQVIAENCRSIEVAIIERRPIADGDVKYTLVQPAPYASGIGLIDADRDVGGRTTQPGHHLGHQGRGDIVGGDQFRSEEHTSELQSLMRISYDVFCLKKNIKLYQKHTTYH